MATWTNGGGGGSGGYLQTATGTGTTTGTVVINDGYANGAAYTFAGSANPPPRELTPLEWLDAEVEKTCALARLKPGG